jgi:L-amino acid N-acyltransferase YncA
MNKRIRKIELSDVEAVRNIYAPFITERSTSFEMEVPSVTAMQERIQGICEQYPWLVFEEDGKVLGYAYGCSHRPRKAYQWSAEVSVYLDEAARGRGVGRALYLALFDILRLQGYANAFAGITLPNPASVGLHEALGFQHIGVFSKTGYKFGQWHDVAWLELRLQEIAPPVPDPIPIAKLISADSLALTFDKHVEAVR